MPNHRPDGPARSNQSAIVVVPFAQMPYAAIFDSRLSLLEHQCLGALLFFALDSDRCFMSDATLARIVQATRAKVNVALGNLEAYGYIRREKVSRAVSGGTGRIVHLVWRTDPSVLPPAPDRSGYRPGEFASVQSEGGPEAGSVPPRKQTGRLKVDEECSPQGTMSVPSREQTGVPPREHKEEGSQELEECRPSSCTDARGSGREGLGGAGYSEAAAEAMASVARCIQATPRTERDARKLIAEVGTEVVAAAAEVLHGEIDGGAVIKYPMRWLERTARLMHAEGGAPGRAIPSANPAATTPRAGRIDAPRPSRHQAEVQRQADAWRAEAERRRRLDSGDRLDGPAPLPGPHFASSVSKAETARLQWNADLDREKAGRKELYGDGD